MELTKAGEAFLEDAQQLLRQLGAAVQRGQQTSRGEVGQLVVGFVGSAAYNVLPPILRSFRKEVPDVTLELRELTTDQQLQRLLNGQIDIGLVRPPFKNSEVVENSEVESEVIFQESLVVALPETHTLSKQDAVSMRSLAHKPFILFPRLLAPGLYDSIISLCQKAGFSPRVVQEAIQMQTIVSLVAAEMGIAIVPNSLKNLQRSGVVYKPLLEATPNVAIALIWQQNPIPTVQRFLEITRQYVMTCTHFDVRT